jgi:SAM-dependent methyltransferase
MAAKLPVHRHTIGARASVRFARMPAPHWFFRFMYDRESAALERQHDQPDHREVDEMTVETLARVVAQPGPVADLGCGPGPHTLGLARRGYDVVGIDGSPRMIKVARERAARDGVEATFRVADLSKALCFADASLGGVLAILVVQHLPDPAGFVAEIRRCLRPEGHVLIRVPERSSSTPSVRRSLYYRLRAAFYTHVPGVVDFYDAHSLRRLVEDAGLSVVTCTSSGSSVAVLARA